MWKKEGRLDAAVQSFDGSVEAVRAREDSQFGCQQAGSIVDQVQTVTSQVGRIADKFDYVVTEMIQLARQVSRQSLHQAKILRLTRSCNSQRRRTSRGLAHVNVPTLRLPSEQVCGSVDARADEVRDCSVRSPMVCPCCEMSLELRLNADIVANTIPKEVLGDINVLNGDSCRRASPPCGWDGKTTRDRNDVVPALDLSFSAISDMEPSAKSTCERTHADSTIEASTRSSECLLAPSIQIISAVGETTRSPSSCLLLDEQPESDLLSDDKQTFAYHAGRLCVQRTSEQVRFRPECVKVFGSQDSLPSAKRTSGLDRSGRCAPDIQRHQLGEGSCLETSGGDFSLGNPTSPTGTDGELEGAECDGRSPELIEGCDGEQEADQFRIPVIDAGTGSSLQSVGCIDPVGENGGSVGKLKPFKSEVADHGSWIEQFIREHGLTDSNVMHVAAREGNLEAVHALLDSCMIERINAQDRKGSTALHVSSFRGHVDVASALLESDRFMKVNVHDREGRTALHLAAFNGRACVVQAILQNARFTEVNARDNEGGTALHDAALRGHVDVVVALLSSQRFVEINMRDNEGWTALHFAASKGSLQVAEVLLACPRFTDVDAQDQKGYTGLLLAASKGHADVAGFLLQCERFSAVNALHNEGWTALHGAASAGCVEVAEALLAAERFTEVNAEDDMKWTALHFAASKGHVGVAQALLDSGRFTKADAKYTGGAGTAFHLAAANGHVDVVKLLLANERFSAVDCCDGEGRTALHLAISEGHLSVAVALLDSDRFTKIHAIDETGLTAEQSLENVISRGNEVARTVLKHARFASLHTKQ